MSSVAVNIDLITGWFPTTVIIVAIASVVLSVGWHDGAWKWQLPIGVPVSFVLTVLTAVAIHVFNLVPDQFPTSFYLWAWLVWYSVVIIVLGWTRAHWLLRTFSVIALIFSVVAAFTVVNQAFDYYPTAAGEGRGQLHQPAPAPGHPDPGPGNGEAARPGQHYRHQHPRDHLQVQHRSGLRLPAPGLVQEPRAPVAGHRAHRRNPR